MKTGMKILSAILAGVPICMMAANPTPAEIMRYAESNKEILVYGTGFEDPKDPSIVLGHGHRYVPGEGNNGNCGLRCDRGKYKIDLQMATIIKLPKDKILPGVKYRVEGVVRGEKIRHNTRPVPPASYRFLEVFFTDAKNRS